MKSSTHNALKVATLLLTLFVARGLYYVMYGTPNWGRAIVLLPAMMALISCIGALFAVWLSKFDEKEPLLFEEPPTP